MQDSKVDHKASFQRLQSKHWQLSQTCISQANRIAAMDTAIEARDAEIMALREKAQSEYQRGYAAGAKATKDGEIQATETSEHRGKTLMHSDRRQNTARTGDLNDG
jgi:hypothetical protein